MQCFQGTRHPTDDLSQLSGQYHQGSQRGRRRKMGEAEDPAADEVHEDPDSKRSQRLSTYFCLDPPEVRNHKHCISSAAQFRLLSKPEKLTSGSAQRLMEDFSCALYRKILLQGRLYVFQRHVCFWANIFGSVVTETIDLRDVTIVRKAKTMNIVPNALEFRLIGGTTAFFTSFIYHDNAYRTILLQWQHYCRYGRIFLPESPSLRRQRTLREQATNDQDICNGTSARDTTAFPEIAEHSSSPESEENDAIDEDDAGNEAAVSKFILDSQSRARADDGEGSADVISTLDVDDTTAAFISGTSYNEVADDTQGEDDTMPECIDADEHLEWPSDMDVIVRDSFECGSLANFFSEFLSDCARSFERRFRECRGDSEVKISAWTSDKRIGLMRDLGFRSPVQSSMGPPTTYCQQTQVCRRYSSGVLLLESSQRMTDIPYAEYFTVDTRLQATERDDGSVDVITGATARFTKSTLFQNRIKQGVMQQSESSTSTWLADAHKLLGSKAMTDEQPRSSHKRRWDWKRSNGGSTKKKAEAKAETERLHGKRQTLKMRPCDTSTSESAASAPPSRHSSEASLSSDDECTERREDASFRGYSVCEEVPAAWQSTIRSVLGVQPMPRSSAGNSREPCVTEEGTSTSNVQCESGEYANLWETETDGYPQDHEAAGIRSGNDPCAPVRHIGNLRKSKGYESLVATSSSEVCLLDRLRRKTEDQLVCKHVQPLKASSPRGDQGRTAGARFEASVHQRRCVFACCGAAAAACACVCEIVPWQALKWNGGNA